MSARDDAFLRKLREFDPPAAERWQKATKGSTEATIDEDMVVDILGPIFQSKKITAKQAAAIDWIYAQLMPKFKPEALALLQIAIENAYSQDFFFAGSKVRFKTADELKEFFGALGAACGKIDFSSPETGVTYSPDQYAAIRQLVQDGKITVFEVDAAWLRGRGGKYRSDIDRLVLYKGPPPLVRQWLIVHEVTHAIQDWIDVKTNHLFAETDAYIAAAAGALGVNESTYNAMQEYPAQKRAAELVLARKAGTGSDEFRAAYTALALQVEKSSPYTEARKTPWGPGPEEKGKNEKKILLEILNKIKKDKAGKKP